MSSQYEMSHDDLRALLDAAFGPTVSVEDYPAVIVALSDIGLTWRLIVELVGPRSVRHEGEVINDVLGLVGRLDYVSEAAVSRARARLQEHSATELPCEPSPSGAPPPAERRRCSYEETPPEQFGINFPLPRHLEAYGEALSSAFSGGPEELLAYTAALEVLRNRSLPPEEIWLLVSRIIPERPKRLMMADIDYFGVKHHSSPKYLHRIEAILNRANEPAEPHE